MWNYKTRSELLDIGPGNDTFGFDTKSKGNEAKIDKCNFIKLKRFYTAKESIRKKKERKKDSPRIGESICKLHIW